MDFDYTQAMNTLARIADELDTVERTLNEYVSTAVKRSRGNDVDGDFTEALMALAKNSSEIRIAKSQLYRMQIKGQHVHRVNVCMEALMGGLKI